MLMPQAFATLRTKIRVAAFTQSSGDDYNEIAAIFRRAYPFRPHDAARRRILQPSTGTGSVGGTRRAASPCGVSFWMLLGERLCISCGAITQAQLDTRLLLQQQTGSRFGDVDRRRRMNYRALYEAIAESEGICLSWISR